MRNEGVGMRESKCEMRAIRHVFFIVPFSFLILLFPGCATTPDKPLPDWVVNPQKTYPSSHYLVAVGEGDSRRAAENSASAGLSRIFEAHIRAEETLSETTTETRGEQESFDQFSKLRANIHIDSDQDLLNVQFGQTFPDHNGRVHTVAFLPRSETAEIYRARIAKNIAAIVLLTHLSDSADTPVSAYALRRAAVRKALKNDQLLTQLGIILPKMKDRVSLHYDPKELYTQTATAGRKVTFAVELTGPGSDALREALTGMGFSESSKTPELTFTEKTELKKSDLQRASLIFVRYRYTVEARDQTGKLVLSFSGSQREGHINFELATDRARRGLRRELLTQIPKELSAFFDRRASAEQK